MNIIIHLLKDDFPDMMETVQQNKIIDAAAALEQEMELKLDFNQTIEMHKAKAVTDLLTV